MFALENLPPVRINGETLPSDQVETLLRQTDPHYAKRTQEELRAQIRRAVEWEFCRRACRAMLACEGIEPGVENASAELRRWSDLLPAGINLAPRHEALLPDPDFQLAVAMLQYFRKTAPEALRPTPRQVEDHYRAHQLDFIRPALPELEILYRPAAEPDAENRLRAARQRLLQGVLFQTVAAEINPESPPECSPRLLLDAARAMRPGDVGEIQKLENTLVVMKVVRVAPAQFLTLKEMTPYIENLLAYQSAMRELKKSLEAERGKLTLQIGAQEDEAAL